MTTSGMHSQTPSKNKEEGRFITVTERDSAYVKIQRGKIDAERVLLLQAALVDCDSAKAVYYDMVGITKMETDSLWLVIKNQDIIIDNLGLNFEDQKKKHKKASFWWFIKGVAAGIVGAAMLLLI